jgi:outer membrane receptor protein involved in Fe transport
VHKDDFRKLNGVLRYTRGDQRGGFSITAMGYGARWRSTDQIPERAVGDGEISRFGSIDPTDGGTTSRYSLESEWERTSSDHVTQISAFAMKYRLNLFSNFTYFLDDPVNGDQFEQSDDRVVSGLRASHRWLAKWNGLSAENVIGFQARRDDIGNIALYHTRARTRLGTERQNRGSETSESLYAQTSLQWTPWLRTIAGLRGDDYQFDVAQRSNATIVSPKLTMIFGPWRNTEVYANAGSGFHSNDARATDTPLVRTRGAEVGVRTTPIPRVHVTASLWRLDMASELVFAGDSGTTEASGASRRTGVEVASTVNVAKWLAVDADYAYSHARFRDGSRIPGAIEGVASVGLNFIDLGPISGELRYRYFGPRPLIEDDSVRSNPSNLINARVGYRLAPRVRIDVDVFNILDAKVSDVDYFYASRLPGEPADGVNDVHFHPVEKRAFRAGVTTTF